MVPVVGERYHHYRNRQAYEIVAVAKHTETEEELVVYRALYGAYQVWVRPLAMFCGTVDDNGVTRPRFERLAQENEAEA